MKPFMKSFMVLGVLSLWAVAELPAQAAWNNVFQPTLFGRLRRTTTSQYVAPAVVYSSPVVVASAPVAAAPACNTCQPQQQCSTSYSQRCFYQPVTTYTTETRYEPVTTYQKSYYYEPVTSYRYSCYYDPCSCSYQQVATPTTSYQLREKNCPVQSWVARCVQVPVTSYQKSCYWQPQTTCCNTTTGALIPVSGSVEAPPPPANPPTITAVPPVNNNPPTITEQKTPPQNYDKSYYPPQNQQQQQPTQQHQGMPNTSWKPNQAQPSLGFPAFPTTSPVPPPPPVKLDRIVVGPDAAVEGTVVRSDNAPRPNAKLLFVNAQQPTSRQSVVANTAGRFHVSLASGAWHVYLVNNDGNAVYHSSLNVKDNQSSQITLVNR